MKNNREATLAEKISKLIENEAKSSDVAALFASVERLERRLDKLETERSRPDSTINGHPSVERFELAEAIADAVLGAPSKEKTCTFEPNGRPCDHCAMCSSRGF